jgi:hypothetical protein
MARVPAREKGRNKRVGSKGARLLKLGVEACHQCTVPHRDLLLLPTIELPILIQSCVAQSSSTVYSYDDMPCSKP